VVQDISERKRLERMKSEFVSTVSHELRTPLTSISGALDLAVGGALGELPEPAMEMLQLAHRNARRLGALVGDLLDLEKLLAGKLSLSRSMQSLQALLVDIVGSLAPYAERFGVRISMHELPRVSLNTDPERLTQVMNNLLSNAIKFSEAGGEVEIEASLSAADVELRVLDRGGGVPEAFRSRLFQSFAQADNSNERNVSGSGLGLSISRELMARLGGDIGYAPREGGGSCFWVRLPISEEAPIVSSEPVAAHVLIVEDDPDVAVVLGMLIAREGFEPVYASNLAAAREQLRTTPVQAITLDLGLGDERGEDLLVELRADPATAELPVLIVSGKPSADDPSDPRTARMSRPLNVSMLIAALKAITSGHDDSTAATILHVEDDSDHARFVQDTLRGAATVMTARSLSEAAGMLVARRFDLVILDLALPDGDGRRLLDALPSPTPPVLVLSQRELAPDATGPFAAVLTKSGTNAEKLERFVRMLLPTPAGKDPQPAPRGAE
jgi:DNA-binding response OmpR family regulator/two-component sensor histidine kinase